MINWIEKNILAGKRPYILILALGFLIYSRAMIFDFSYLDDDKMIINSQFFISHLSNIFAAFQHDVFLSALGTIFYRPIMTVSLILDAQISGTNPFMYHFTNIIIHLAVTCLVFLMFRKLNYKRDLSFFLALVFAVIPVLSQAVAWIPGRNDSLLALFILASFMFFLKFMEKRKSSYLLGHFLFFALALFTKETAIMFPIIILYYLLFIYSREYYQGQNSKNKIGLLVLRLIAGWGIISLIWLWLRHSALNHPIPVPFSLVMGSITTNLPAIIQFLGKIIFPFNLSGLPIMQDVTYAYGLLTLFLVILAVIFTKNKRWNYLFFGMLWFIFFFLPTLIWASTDSSVAIFPEHRLYVPIFGFFIVMAELEPLRRINFNKSISLILASGILIFFSILTVNHIQIFQDRLVFWENAVKSSPHSALAHDNLGDMYYFEKQMDKAESEYKKSLEFNDREVPAYNNLGVIYTDRGQFDIAEQEFKKMLEINPNSDDGYNNLGLLYYKFGDFKAAEENWKKAVELNPDHVSALQNLAALDNQEKRYDEANYYLKELEKRGIKISPEPPQN